MKKRKKHHRKDSSSSSPSTFRKQLYAPHSPKPLPRSPSSSPSSSPTLGRSLALRFAMDLTEVQRFLAHKAARAPRPHQITGAAFMVLSSLHADVMLFLTLRPPR